MYILIISLLLSSLSGMLSGCGGTVIGTKSEPPAPVATNDFLQMATQTSCANLSNRLFVIDQSQVFWDKAGNCADSAYSQTLYASSPDKVLCRSADSIAGPQNTCTDPQYANLFKTIIANLDKIDLGLGSTHQVQQLPVAAGVSTALNIISLDSAFFHGNPPANAVIRDKDAWSKLMTLGNIQAPLTYDHQFSNTMLLGTFFKTPNNCSVTQILRVSSNGQKLQAEYTEQERVAVMSCDPNSTMASTPMNLVEVRALNLPVEFSNVNAVLLNITTISNDQYSGVTVARNEVVKDLTAWNKLWAEHSKAATPAPVVDFNKNMVVGVFLGKQASGCYGIADLKVWRSNAQLHVSHHDTTPAKGVMCTVEVPTPTYLAVVTKSDEAVDFNAISVLH